ncbi:PAS domain-containing sensor histidine kinase [Pedosphaera parvula]|uniref:histidine kinase n=1 Tax=Pedosphaera parvula (strain Ellin514) TaxID=320771 RepID=B9XIR4_PEDPL|nr:PAS domain S-box protein [Pedosphaera parvula]EEF60327.1 PAS/PAC sensor signal transduction histidine kinase [Pedosphaera parvula Ellin514]
MRRFEDHYQVLFENNPLPMWVYDLDSLAFVAVNTAAIQHYGYSREEFLKMTILDIRPLEDIPRLKAAIPKQQTASNIGFQKVGVWRHRKKDGSLIHVDVSSEQVTYEGKAARLALLNDVTELKRSTAQVHLLETCIARVNDVVIITEAEPLDEPGPRIVFVNEAFTKYTGYSQEEAIGQSPRFLQGPKTSHTIRQRIRAALESKTPTREEIINYTKSGEQVWWEIEITPIIDERGRCTHFVAIQRDVTERKRSEKALKQSETRLKEAQRVANIGSWEWNVTERKVMWSDELYRIFGLEPQSFPITANSFLESIHPDDRPMMREKIEEMRKHARPFREHYRIVRPDGAVRHIFAHGEFACDNNTKVVRLMGTVQDITDRKIAEESRIRTAKLETANKELESFSYSVSHDLRAPLRTIDGFSRMLIEDYGDKLDETGKSYLEFISSAAHRMSQLIQDLLELSRVTSSQIHRNEFNLSALTETVAGELRQQDPERKAAFYIQPDLMVNADQRLMRIVMENLLRNAWKFTSKIPAARIEFGMFARDTEKVYFVRDNGAGFDMAFADRLFGVFQRLHPEADFAGTGIGLATVHRIIGRHGGRVWAEGAVDQGATFYFTLPA